MKYCRIFITKNIIILVTACLLLSAWEASAVQPVEINIDVKGIGASTGGPLTISRVELVFDNNRGDITVPLNGEVRAKAFINYTGNGVLNALWVVDGRVIQQVNKSLTYGNSIIIETNDVPPLPAFEPGPHTLTLQITNPAESFSIPAIEYYVTTSVGKADIMLYTPENGVFLYKNEISFSWNNPVETAFYQVIVWQKTKSVISALTKDLSYRPPDAVLDRLSEGTGYSWQVVALDSSGRELGSSNIRNFRIRDERESIIFRDIQINKALTTEGVKGVIPLEEEFTGSRNINLTANVKSGEEIPLVAVIENWTRKTARQVLVEFKVDGEIISRQVIPTLQPGEYTSIKAIWRTPVQGSHERYQNIETDEQLEKLEDSDGLAILASNIRGQKVTVEARIQDKLLDKAAALLSTGFSEREEYCLGAVGSQCGQPGQMWSSCTPTPSENPPSGNGSCSVSGASWEHDSCCFRNPDGFMCDAGPEGDFLKCGAEFMTAIKRMASGLEWKRDIDYTKVNTTGRVVFEDYCAPAGWIIHANDVQYCCSNKARNYIPFTYGSQRSNQLENSKKSMEEIISDLTDFPAIRSMIEMISSASSTREINLKACVSEYEDADVIVYSGFNFSGSISGDVYDSLDFSGSIAGDIFSGLNFRGSLAGNVYDGLDFSGSFAGGKYSGLDFSGTITGGVFSGLDFNGKSTFFELGKNDATGIDFIAHTLGRNDATGVDFKAYPLGKNDATGINFIAHTLGRNDATGVDFKAYILGKNDATGIDFIAHTLGRNDATGVDFKAYPLGKNDATGINFIAHTLGINDATGIDFKAYPLGKNDATGIDFTAHTLGINDATGVDFKAYILGKNDATGINFIAHTLGRNDATGVDFKAYILGKNDATGIDFRAYTLGRNDATGVDFKAYPLGKNDATSIDFIAHTLGINDATGVDFKAYPLGKNDATGINFIAHTLGRNDATGVDFKAYPLGKNDVTGVDFKR